MTSLADIRSQFLEFFKDNGHEIVASAPLVPDDPTLLFTNAGMVPFKNIFTGVEPAPYPRAVSSQKCVRAGGKHNDLDNVGYTARHHTFFEMLGNFSFGDYFKEQAIAHAWRLVTKDFGLPADKLTVTVYAEDEEAFDLWRKIAGLPEERIIRIATSDNFWSMGDTGPCGPCSEIFYDHGPEIWGGPPGSAEEDGDRFVEIWNLVFMQYEQHGDGRRENLPKPSIDTGMGLERIAAVLQGVHSNYEVDLFRTLIGASEGVLGTPKGDEAKASHRVIADHLRSSAFLIADGVSPSNEGRGYVLRRIMRRGMRHAHMLGAKGPVMHQLVPTLVGEMGAAFPELARAEAAVTQTLRQEEERFRETLGRGLALLEDAASSLREGDAFSGATAFKLYDTYGFPVDLTEDVLRPRGISVDHAGFEAAMSEQKAKGRASWRSSGSSGVDADWAGLRRDLPATEFLGYAKEKADGALIAIVKDGQRVDTLEMGEEGELVFDQTPFYAESGGQIGDTGTITLDGAKVEVLDTVKQAGDLFVHRVRVAKGPLREGEGAKLAIDADRRAAIRSNHSATHLMHAALRNVLGAHVVQKGSYVGPDRLRFDFSHTGPVTADELAAIEAEVNAVIRQNAPAKTAEMTMDEAVEGGALALFGEKYAEKVRVLRIGKGLDSVSKPYSMELCGGVHVARTGDIALFKIIAESGVAAGVRRIEALTGEAAKAWLDEQAARANELAEALKVPPAQAKERLTALLEERRSLERALSEAKRKLAAGGGAGAPAGPEDVAGVKLIARVAEGVGGKDLRQLIDQAKSDMGSGVAVFIGVTDGKAAVAVGVTKDLSERFDARELVRVAAEAVGGRGGGGRPDMAQAGGPDGSKAEAALTAVREAITTAASEAA